MARSRPALARLIRIPALHFLLLGGLLFVGDHWWQKWSTSNASASVQETIVISAEQIKQIGQDFMAQNGVRPTSEQLSSATEDLIEEEILFRQARAIGLHHENEAVRKRLVQIARFVAQNSDQDEDSLYQTALQLQLDRSDTVVRRQLAMLMRLAAANSPIAGETMPDDAELDAYLQRHPERFMQPWRISLWHVYLSEDQRGDATEADAQRLLVKLRANSPKPDAAPELGDPFLLGHNLVWQTRQGLRKIFGGTFADEMAQIEPGVWSGPVRSGYGWHLIWVQDVQQPATPAIAAVRDRVFRAALEERREWRVRETLKAMRAKYSITVEMPVKGRTDTSALGNNG